MTYINRLSPIQTIAIHLLFVVGLYWLLVACGFVNELTKETRILQWDANWYKSIAQSNYWYSTKEQSNSGFFPLFPFFWKYLNTSAIGICLINWFISLTGIFFLAKTFTISNTTILQYLSLPSLFFCYVPYAESLFFAFGTLLLYGIKKDLPLLVFIGCFLAACTKATAIFFIPSFAIMLLFSIPFNQINVFKTIQRFLFFSFSVCLGIAAVVLIQYAQTGVWFAYFKTQSSMWGRIFNIPVFPLTTWDAHRILSLDIFAFILGTAALAVFLLQSFRSIISNKTKAFTNDASYWFSVGFLIMVLFSILFFNPIDAATQTTSILSINRYMLVSPFVLVVLHQHSFSIKLTTKQLLGSSLFIILILLSFKWNLQPHSIILFICLVAYIVGYVLMLVDERFKNFRLLYYFINCVLQLLLFDSFISAYWVG
ncbi:MAG: hypothetical protein IPP56_04180 [Bacteroidetes bacterium]|nr:hypothetical protein [Bacteroidota bacterium]